LGHLELSGYPLSHVDLRLSGFRDFSG
jgi:hypothetical protein